LFFSTAIVLTASATAEFGTSVTMSTPWSNHCRAIPAPTSGLFWWSASITSTCRPRDPAKSCTACRAQATEVRPDVSL